MKKSLVSLTCCAVLGVYAVTPINVFASEQNEIDVPLVEEEVKIDQAFSSVSTDPYLPVVEQNEDSMIGPQWIQIVVFVGGILAGYIIDGAIVYATGQPAANWVAKGMAAAKAWQKNHSGNRSDIHVSKDGAIFGGGGRPF